MVQDCSIVVYRTGTNAPWTLLHCRPRQCFVTPRYPSSTATLHDFWRISKTFHAPCQRKNPHPIAKSCQNARTPPTSDISTVSAVSLHAQLRLPPIESPTSKVTVSYTSAAAKLASMLAWSLSIVVNTDFKKHGVAWPGSLYTSCATRATSYLHKQHVQPHIYFF